MATNKKPVLTILAGPNGAGKSTFSKKLTTPKTIRFDGDKEIDKIEKKYTKIYGNFRTPIEILTEIEIGQLFFDSINKAIQEKKNFILETNFRTKDVMKTVNTFKQNDFKTRLIHLALPNIKDSLERVQLREKKGGHQVDTDSIKHNFKEGIKNLIKYAAEFDQIKIAKNNIEKIGKIIPLLTLEKGKTPKINNDLGKYKNLVDKVIQNLPKNLTENLPKKPTLSPRNLRQPKKGFKI